MVATLRICNVACCLERFGFLGVIDISDTFRDGILDVPKRHLNINLKFGLHFSPNKLTFPLDLPAEALGINYQ